MMEQMRENVMPLTFVADADIYANIRNLMRKRQVTSDECADYLGVDVDAFERWLDGGEDIPPSYLVPLAEFLDVSVTTLLLPDAKDDNEFPLMRRSALRLRQLMRLSMDTQFDMKMLRECMSVREVRFENPAIALTRDAKKVSRCVEGENGEPHETGPRSIYDMSDDEFGAVVSWLEKVSEQVYDLHPDISANLAREYERIARYLPVVSSVMFMHKQALMCNIHEDVSLRAADDWHDVLAALGWMPDNLDDFCDFDDAVANGNVDDDVVD